MKEIDAIFRSQFIIDGLRQDCTPADLLEGLKAPADSRTFTPSGKVITDETLEHPVSSVVLEESDIPSYLKSVQKHTPSFRLDYPVSSTVNRLYQALLEAVQYKGNFLLEDLEIKVLWKWNTEKVGAMAAFYQSVQALCETLEILPVGIASYDFRPSSQCSLEISVDRPSFRAVPQSAVKDSSSWIVYVPFETSEYRIGGSSLASVLGIGGQPLRLQDPDYFLDCFEVAREMIEDGIVLSSSVVGPGGLLPALKSMTGLGLGIGADLSQLCASHKGTSVPALLFSEVPGLLLQIRDEDFDYLDAEFILQDVAFYALGHPDKSSGDVVLTGFSESGLGSILSSLITKRK